MIEEAWLINAAGSETLQERDTGSRNMIREAASSGRQCVCLEREWRGRGKRENKLADEKTLIRKYYIMIDSQEISLQETSVEPWLLRLKKKKRSR